MPKFDDISKKLSDVHHAEEEELLKTLSVKYGHQYLNLYGIVINTDALRLVPEDVSRRTELAVFARSGTKLSVALRNPNNKEALTLIESLKGRHFVVTMFMVSTASLEHAWDRYKDVVATSASEYGVLGIAPEEIARMATSLTTVGDVTRMVASLDSGSDRHNISVILTVLLGGALSLGASDMHIEPEERATRLRYRLDGVLWDIADIDTHTYELIRSRLKLLSGLKLNRTDRAQDGRFTINVSDKEYEIRTSIIPSAYGETVVMRFLDPESITVDMKDFGINTFLLPIILEELKRPNGMILTTGPTGSGKTTALYAFLRMVHTSEIKIITIEDPIEYHLDGIVQTQVSEEYSFASGLRSILRQNPNVIMVGEIRDGEVAETAINAALTGHLVFSTLHSNSAVGSFPRLRDLGVDPRTMASAVNLVLAQRLVRALCPHCKKARALSLPEKTRFQKILASYPKEVVLDTAEVYESVGCKKCGGSGFNGRIGIFEGIRMTPLVEEALFAGVREKEILEAAQEQKIPTIAQDGLMKVLEGSTSLPELERVVDIYK